MGPPSTDPFLGGRLARAEGERHRKLPPVTVPEDNATPNSGGAGTTGNQPTGPSFNPLRPQAGRDTPPVQSMDPEHHSRVEHRACPDPHPIDTLAESGEYPQIEAGPNGGLYYLWERALPAKKPGTTRRAAQFFFQASAGAAPELMAESPHGYLGFEISPDGSRVALLEDDGARTGHLAILDVGSRQMTRPPPSPFAPVESMAWAPRSPWLFYTASHRSPRGVDLYRYDVKAAKATQLAPLDGLFRVTDVAPNEQTIALSEETGKAAGKVWVWNVGTHQLTSVTGGDSLFREGRFTADSGALLLISDQERGVQRLYRYPLKGSDRPKVMTATKGDVESFTLDAARATVVYVSNEDGYTHLGGFTMDSSGRAQALLQLPDAESSVVRAVSLVSIPSRSPGEKVLFISDSASNILPRIRAWKPPQLVDWTPDPSPRSPCFVPPTLVHFSSFDRRLVPAFLFTSATRDEGTGEGQHQPRPTVILVHDGFDGQFRPAFHPQVQYFLRLGFAVLAPNYRGSQGYGREYRLLDQGKKRADVVRDVLAAADWLIGTRRALLGQLRLVGSGYGGLLALNAALSAPRKFAAVAAIAPWLELTDPVTEAPLYRRAKLERGLGSAGADSLPALGLSRRLIALKLPALIFPSPWSTIPGATRDLSSVPGAKAGLIEVRESSDVSRDTTGLVAESLASAKWVAQFFDDSSREKKKGP